MMRSGHRLRRPRICAWCAGTTATHKYTRYYQYNLSLQLMQVFLLGREDHAESAPAILIDWSMEFADLCAESRLPRCAKHPT